MPLTDTRIRNAKPKDKPYKLTDSKGLHIEIRPTGAKLWRYRYSLPGTRRDGTPGLVENVYAMGDYCQPPAGETPEQAEARRAADQYTLEEARQERLRLRGLVKRGIHPVEHRRTNKLQRQTEGANTFEAIAREWLERNKPHWSDRYYKRVRSVLEREVFPGIGALPIRDVTAAHLLPLMQTVAKRGAEVVAVNVRVYCGAIFAYAVTTLRADGDPTIVLRRAIKVPDTKHKTPLTKEQIAELLKKLQSDTGAFTKYAMRLLLLTWVRPSEIRGAEWSEFDLDAAEWRIPAARMKMRELHVVPLSTQAVELLRELQKLTGTNRYLFPNYRRANACMSDGTLNKALHRLGYKERFTAHGFRATASTILNELGQRHDVIERQLAHSDRDKVRASYNHAQYMPERRAMMQQWADLVDAWASGTNVTSIKRAA